MTDQPGEVGAPAAGLPLRAAPLLEIAGVTKRFGALVACDDISIAVQPGEVRGLLGQNGAGKSTLMKVVVGLEPPTAGEVRIAGTPVSAGDPAASAAAGVAMVHQHFSLVERLTVWQNVVLGEHGRLDRHAAAALVRAVGERYGLDIDPDARVEDLSAGMRQRVEIVKCLRRDPKVIILDEPTSVLTSDESRRLFSVLRELVQTGGHAAVLISHRLEEILDATDNVTILRDGRLVDTVATSSTDAASLARMMLGREVKLEREAAAIGLEIDDASGAARAEANGRTGATAAVRCPELRGEGNAALELHDVRVDGEDGRPLLTGLTLGAYAGEIVGIAGVEGNGQDVLVDVLSGITHASSGRIVVRRRDGDAARMLATDLAAIGVIPADRHESGCALDMSVAENLVLTCLEDVLEHGLVSRRLLDARARELIAEFQVSVADVHAPMWTLSGGNQQKVVLARELSRRPPVLVAAQPTRGLDVGAMEYLWGRLRAAAADGTAILLVSTELDEVLALSDRVAVIHRGAIVGEMARAEVDTERLGLMMGGRAA
jgi:general nucleoside transport system ATP-binding protein